MILITVNRIFARFDVGLTVQRCQHGHFLPDPDELLEHRITTSSPMNGDQLLTRLFGRGDLRHPDDPSREMELGVHILVMFMNREIAQMAQSWPLFTFLEPRGRRPSLADITPEMTVSEAYQNALRQEISPFHNRQGVSPFPFTARIGADLPARAAPMTKMPEPEPAPPAEQRPVTPGDIKPRKRILRGKAVKNLPDPE